LFWLFWRWSLKNYLPRPASNYYPPNLSLPGDTVHMATHFCGLAQMGGKHPSPFRWAPTFPQQLISAGLLCSPLHSWSPDARCLSTCSCRSSHWLFQGKGGWEARTEHQTPHFPLLLSLDWFSTDASVPHPGHQYTGTSLEQLPPSHIHEHLGSSIFTPLGIDSLESSRTILGRNANYQSWTKCFIYILY
jgi:hypothetical protein